LCRSIPLLRIVGFTTHSMPEEARMDHSLY